MENATATDKRRALGRGLDSLLPSRPHVVAGTAVPVPPPVAEPHLPVASPDARPQAAVIRIKLDQIDENPYQTRRAFDEKALQELADSIRASGIVQPIVVRPTATGRYILILGERR